MPITVETLRAAVVHAQARLPYLEEQLNAADALLGDGDTGSMLARVIERMAADDLSGAADVGEAFSALARATMSATGSSLGTLIATALMSFAKATKGQGQVSWCNLSCMIQQAVTTMSQRGGACLGDKTILDSLHAISEQLTHIQDGTAAAQAAASGALTALIRFQPQICKIGRARLFPEKSAGAHDPGMLALALLLESPGLGEEPASVMTENREGS